MNKQSKQSRKPSRHLRLWRRYFLLGIIAAAICAAFVLSGCANTPAVVDALSRNTNRLHLQVTGPGYSIQADRN